MAAVTVAAMESLAAHEDLRDRDEARAMLEHDLAQILDLRISSHAKSTTSTTGRRNINSVAPHGRRSGSMSRVAPRTAASCEPFISSAPKRSDRAELARNRGDRPPCLNAESGPLIERGSKSGEVRRDLGPMRPQILTREDRIRQALQCVRAQRLQRARERL